MDNDITHHRTKASKKAQPPFLGLLMLETNFPRFIGDIGNPGSFPFPVLMKTVTGASPHAVIKGPQEAFLQPFMEAAEELEAAGAKIISASCGFLTSFQGAIQEAVSIPVLASSLFLHGHLSTLVGRQRKVGILTIAASSLSQKHLEAANIQPDTPIGTTENGCEFTRAILENRPVLDFEKSKDDNVEAAKALNAAHRDLGAILLECTNMPPYADAIRTETGLPVFSILDGLNALWEGEITDITLRQGAGSDSRNSA